MGKLDTVKNLFEIGGIKLVLLRLRDKLYHGDKCYEYMHRIFETAEPEEYPKLLKCIWVMKFGEPLDLENLKTFNEKIQWLKLYDTTPLKTKLSDKYLVRNWIKEKIGEQYLVPLLGVWNSFDEIDFDKLPEKFVLKCNHGSGMNLVVKEKKTLNIELAKQQFDEWMKINYAFEVGFELQYKDIPRKIIAEQYIEQMDKNLLDYKIHVFGGEPRIIQVIGDRDLAHHTGKEAFFDLNWQSQDLMYHTYDMYEKLPEKPDNLNEMLDIARILGEEFRYVRVDLYNGDGRILFGEMTFTPMSGFGKWEDIQAAYLVGSWINVGK